MKIKKIVSFLLLMFILILVGCKKEGNNLVLRVYNWQDYIEDGKKKMKYPTYHIKRLSLLAQTSNRVQMFHSS